MSKCWKFCPGIEIKADFHSKMSVCRHELGGGVELPPTIPTVHVANSTKYNPITYIKYAYVILEGYGRALVPRM